LDEDGVMHCQPFFAANRTYLGWQQGDQMGFEYIAQNVAQSILCQNKIKK
jgi:hypothetical protein